MKRSVAALICACLLLAPGPFAYAASLTVSVLAEASVKGPGLTLGDIATVGGDLPERVRMLKELSIGDAPAPGETMFLTPELLKPRLIAAKADFSDITWTVPANFKVTTLSQRISGKKISELALAFLQQQAVGATLNMLDVPSDFQAPAGKLEMVAEISGSLRYSVPTTVQVVVRTEGKPFVRVPVQFEVRRYLDIVVAATNLNAGEVLTAQSLRLERMDAGKLPAGYYTEAGKMVGLQLRYAAVPGAVIYEKALMRPIVIQRGAMVRLSSRIGELEVSANGVALASGAVGDIIRVQNSNTKRMLTGRVQEDKSVLVLDQPGG